VVVRQARAISHRHLIHACLLDRSLHHLNARLHRHAALQIPDHHELRVVAQH
jgi:hypothetical protein